MLLEIVEYVLQQYCIKRILWRQRRVPPQPTRDCLEPAANSITPGWDVSSVPACCSNNRVVLYCHRPNRRESWLVDGMAARLNKERCLTMVKISIEYCVP